MMIFSFAMITISGNTCCVSLASIKMRVNAYLTDDASTSGVVVVLLRLEARILQSPVQGDVCISCVSAHETKSLCATQSATQRVK